MSDTEPEPKNARESETPRLFAAELDHASLLSGSSAVHFLTVRQARDYNTCEEQGMWIARSTLYMENDEILATATKPSKSVYREKRLSSPSLRRKALSFVARREEDAFVQAAP